MSLVIVPWTSDYHPRKAGVARTAIGCPQQGYEDVYNSGMKVRISTPNLTGKEKLHAAQPKRFTRHGGPSLVNSICSVDIDLGLGF